MLRTWVREWVEEDLIHLAVDLVEDNNIHSTLKEDFLVVDLVVFSFNIREACSSSIGKILEKEELHSLESDIELTSSGALEVLDANHYFESIH